MTPVSKLAIVVATLSIGGAGAAYAITQTPQMPAGAAPAVEKADFGGHGWGRGGGRGAGGPGGPRGMMMMEIMRQADTNGDGALGQDEIDAFVTGEVQKADTDGTPGVSLDEFKTIWLDVTNQPMVRTFQFVDSDGNGVISETEINERFGDVVARMDRNDDGKLDRDDRPRHGKRFGMHHGRHHDEDRDDD